MHLNLNPAYFTHLNIQQDPCGDLSLGMLPSQILLLLIFLICFFFAFAFASTLSKIAILQFKQVATGIRKHHGQASWKGGRQFYSKISNLTKINSILPLILYSFFLEQYFINKNKREQKLKI